MSETPSNPELDLSGLTEGQLKLLDHLYEAGPEGIDIITLFKQAKDIGFTPDDQAELVTRKLWGTKPGNIIVHPEFAKLPENSKPDPEKIITKYREDFQESVIAIILTDTLLRHIKIRNEHGVNPLDLESIITILELIESRHVREQVTKYMLKKFGNHFEPKAALQALEGLENWRAHLRDYLKGKQ